MGVRVGVWPLLGESERPDRSGLSDSPSIHLTNASVHNIFAIYHILVDIKLTF